MIPCLISCCVTMLPVLFPQVHAELVKREKAKLQGAWIFDSVIRDGRSIRDSWPTRDNRIPKWVFNGDQLNWSGGLPLGNGASKYEIDLRNSPKHLDLIPDPDPDRDSRFRPRRIYSKFIYSLEGDKLTIAWSSNLWHVPTARVTPTPWDSTSEALIGYEGGALLEQSRPINFGGQSGSDDIVWVLKRVQK